MRSRDRRGPLAPGRGRRKRLRRGLPTPLIRASHGTGRDRENSDRAMLHRHQSIDGAMDADLQRRMSVARLTAGRIVLAACSLAHGLLQRPEGGQVLNRAPCDEARAVAVAPDVDRQRPDGSAGQAVQRLRREPGELSAAGRGERAGGAERSTGTVRAGARSWSRAGIAANEGRLRSTEAGADDSGAGGSSHMGRRVPGGYRPCPDGGSSRQRRSCRPVGPLTPCTDVLGSCPASASCGRAAPVRCRSGNG